MICSLRSGSLRPLHGSQFFSGSKSLIPTKGSSFLPPLPARKINRQVTLSLSRPLHVSSAESFGPSRFTAQKEDGLTKCGAYEADRSEAAAAAGSEVSKKVKIGIYFATWWALNVVFNIYNKKVLNAYPYPWLTSTLSLAAGSLMMLISWATRIAETPKTDY